MCSADEVSFVNTLDRTDLAAGAAIYTLFVIYRSKIVLYDDSAGGAGLFAFSAGNTAVLTINAYLSAFIMVVTGYRYTRGISNKMDYIVRAFLDAHTAANTFSWVYCSKSLVVYTNCISRANLNAVAISKAGEGAVVVAGVV